MSEKSENVHHEGIRSHGPEALKTYFYRKVILFEF